MVYSCLQVVSKGLQRVAASWSCNLNMTPVYLQFSNEDKGCVQSCDVFNALNIEFAFCLCYKCGGAAAIAPVYP
jgi:hypothetical protein